MIGRSFADANVVFVALEQITTAETVDGHSVSSEVRTWLAPGVGPVKSEVIIDELGTSHVADENQLTSFTKG